MKRENNWQHKSLLILERIKAVDPDELPTRLLKRVYELISVPLAAYLVEDLRLMIGQEIGLYYLIPIAIEKLRCDLFAEGDFYEGDLLASILNVNPLFWKQNPELHIQIKQLTEHKRDEIISIIGEEISFEKIDAPI